MNNGIVILQTKDGYRVAYSDELPFDLSPNNLKKIFGEREVYETYAEAFEEAVKIEQDWADEGFYLEYGIITIKNLRIDLSLCYNDGSEICNCGRACDCCKDNAELKEKE